MNPIWDKASLEKALRNECFYLNRVTDPFRMQTIKTYSSTQGYDTLVSDRFGREATASGSYGAISASASYKSVSESSSSYKYSASAVSGMRHDYVSLELRGGRSHIRDEGIRNSQKHIYIPSPPPFPRR